MCIYLFQIIAAGEAWPRQCSDAVVLLSTQGLIGESMFKHRLIDIVGSQVGDHISTQLCEFLCNTIGAEATDDEEAKANQVVDEALCTRWRDALLISIHETIVGVMELPSRRMVDIPYRGGLIPKVAVSWLGQEIDLRIAAFIRQIGVAQSSLPEMAAEKALGLWSKLQDKAFTIGPALLEKATGKQIDIYMFI